MGGDLRIPAPEQDVMELIDLTHATTRKAPRKDAPRVVVRSAGPIDCVPIEALVTPATVVDLTDCSTPEITRHDISKTPVADIGGCILRTNWCDSYLAGSRWPEPSLTVEAAMYLLEGGVGTIASDFRLADGADELLLHNNCVLIHCVSSVGQLTKPIVTLIALPLKLKDTYSAEARVIAMEE